MAYVNTLLAVILLAVPALAALEGQAPQSRKSPYKYPDALWKEEDELKFIFAGQKGDQKPAFAVLHVFLHCRTTYLETRKMTSAMLREEYWPNVYYKRGQDAAPTLYIFNAERKVVHRYEIVDKTFEEIKELLNSHGFHKRPDAEEEKKEAEKTEL